VSAGQALTASPPTEKFANRYALAHQTYIQDLEGTQVLALGRAAPFGMPAEGECAGLAGKRTGQRAAAGLMNA
jgi:hypothetical protein